MTTAYFFKQSYYLQQGDVVFLPLPDCVSSILPRQINLATSAEQLAWFEAVKNDFLFDEIVT